MHEFELHADSLCGVPREHQIFGPRLIVFSPVVFSQSFFFPISRRVPLDLPLPCTPIIDNRSDLPVMGIIRVEGDPLGRSLGKLIREAGNGHTV